MKVLQRIRRIKGCKDVISQDHNIDQYVKSIPSHQNAIDLFKGEWSSRLPDPYANLSAGSLPLFEDPRIIWAAEKLGGIEDKTVLELGPLEGGHTFMLECFGASSIISIESNKRAFLKCLVVKNLLQLKKAQFLLGDFMTYLRENQDKFDIVIASGILYHMENPVKLIELIAKTTDRLFIWTHYYDHEIISKNYELISRNPRYKDRFTSSSKSEHAGFQHTLYRQEYGNATSIPAFCGGSNYFSNWMNRKDIISCLEYFGFNEIQIGFEEPCHINGPSFSVAAIRNN
jgi:hypothetical protein